MKSRYHAIRGTRDILPDEIGRWQLVERTAREVFERYGFREVRTPVLEATDLFARSVGASTDIVRKEMYTFLAGDESVTLRPEATAPVVRAFVEHALHRTVAAGYPERYYYIGPMFRYERPQKGRQRQFHQIGAEVLGAAEPLADAETLEMLWSFLEALGIGDRELTLNSVGDGACRPRFREALLEWLAPRRDRLCEDCRRRMIENPLRVFDCKVEEDRKLLEDAPSSLDHLCEGCASHFTDVRSALDAYGIPYRIDSRIVRGLDYYERTVFEVVSRGLGSQNAILGGGRYDGLVEEIGGPRVPGFGFAMGIERLVLLLPEDRGRGSGADLLLVCLGEKAWRASVGLARRLRAAGLRVTMPLLERPMGAQLKRAERVGARYALFVGDGELEHGRFGLKDLATGEQVTVDELELLARLGGRHGN
jgi:histidyl-tRNA synthetase